MKHRLLFFFMAFAVMAAALNAEAAQKKKTVDIQWQYRISDTAEDFPMYELYLYNSKTDELTSCLFFSSLNEPDFSETRAGLPYFFWWYGGGGFEIVVENTGSALVVRKIGMDEGSGETREEDLDPSYEAAKNVVCKLEAGEKINVLPPKELEKPEFSRELKIVKPHAYGDDIRYLQFLLCACYGQSIDIDGYFGRQTETAVKDVQKQLNLAQTGIVDKALWDKITDTLEYKTYTFCF